MKGISVRERRFSRYGHVFDIILKMYLFYVRCPWTTAKTKYKSLPKWFLILCFSFRWICFFFSFPFGKSFVFLSKEFSRQKKPFLTHFSGAFILVSPSVTVNDLKCALSYLLLLIFFSSLFLIGTIFKLLLPLHFFFRFLAHFFHIRATSTRRFFD